MGTGHKRSLKCIYEQLKKKGVNVDLLKQKINDLIIKTIICGLPLLSHQYKCCQPEDYSNSMCFHVLGFDVMMDSK
jgi:tubulin polyglutamylase TTLL6/13